MGISVLHEDSNLGQKAKRHKQSSQVSKYSSLLSYLRTLVSFTFQFWVILLPFSSSSCLLMDSSQLFGGTEECNSSESGWTMYIGSPTPTYSVGDDKHSDGGENDDDDDDDDDDNDDDDYDASHGDDSDDSMASDASSGPSHRERPCGKGGYGHGMNCFEYNKNEGDSKYSTHKKADSRAEKQRAERRRNEEKAESKFMAKKANIHVGSNSKVRNNNWMGKRK